MQAGKLNKRVKLIRQVKSSDGYGGWYSDESVIKTFWADKKEVDGTIDMKDGKRRHYTRTEFVVRKNTLSDLKDDDVFQIEGEQKRFRFNNHYELINDYYVKIIATKTDY